MAVTASSLPKLLVLLAACILAATHSSSAAAVPSQHTTRKLTTQPERTQAQAALPSLELNPAPASDTPLDPVSDNATSFHVVHRQLSAICTTIPVISLSLNDWRAQMLALINNARAAHGVRPVCQNAKLNSASQAQSNTRVYGHTWSFVYGTCYSWSTLGQNIAMGQTSPQQVFNAWFNEVPPNDGHRRNILNPAFNQVGNGWTTGINMWTQNFGYSATERCY